VRGDRLLLTGARIDVLPAAANGNAAGLDWMRPFEVAVRVLDLATGELRDLGTAPGGWTQWTAIPHLYGSDHAPACGPRSAGGSSARARRTCAPSRSARAAA